MDADIAPQRRMVCFATIDAALADAERLVAAERGGTLLRCGNWNLGRRPFE